MVLALSAFMPDHLSAQGVSTQTGKSKGAGMDLGQNYPNPFNPRTKIRFTLKQDAQALLRVYDVRGRLIRTLIDSFIPAGTRVVEWDGTDERGSPLASGTYFLRLEAAGDYESRSVTLLK